MLPPPVRIPRATYRFQFNKDFDFAQAQKLVSYIASLGISDLYASPLFQASTSSTHGYDVNDYNLISASLGGLEGLNRLSTAMRQEQLGLLLDFVPNHMGIDGEHNTWWSHVLENGAQSSYAPYFDIEWHPRIERLNDRVLVPMLDDRYGAVLQGGRFRLAFSEGRFLINYGAMKLPVRPGTYSFILNQVDELLASGDERKARLRKIAEDFDALPPHDPEARDVQLVQLKLELARLLDSDRSLQDLLRTALSKVNGNPSDPASFGLLHELLEKQHYRLAYWKVGAHEVNYRRFFAVDTLVGLKMEKPEVFAATHRLLGELIANGTVNGIRLDHIDGLWNPAEYLVRLADLVKRENPGASPLYTIVEKILAPGEDLPSEWQVHGTTGYEFTASLIELFLDRNDELAWTRIYEDFIHDRRGSRDLTYEDKLFALQEIFPNAVSNLATELDALIEPDWHSRDISLHDLKTALRHFLACLPVYRTYHMPGEDISKADKKWVTQAVEEGVRRNRCVDPTALRFVGRVITGEYLPPYCSDEQRTAFASWVCKLQQATGAVMAKSVEDTHFYRYVRMFGANEVGGHPSRFGLPVSEFHQTNLRRKEQTPFCLLATSTHDTKVSEDARARLFALAELPDEWESHLKAWHHLNQPARSEIEGRSAPDTREEYLLYQALLAAWPLQASDVDDPFRQRMKDYFRKAQAESKLNTTWTYPHQGWQEAGDRFIDALLDSDAFLSDFAPFANRIAHRGMIFSLAQTVLRLTSPGVPDLYQGNELWDFSLVDPDNRRPVDFDLRIERLASLDSSSSQDLLENWQHGTIKMKIIQSILRCRRNFPDLFTIGDYTCLQAQGEKADHAVAFLRRYAGVELLVVVPRRLGTGEFPFRAEDWKTTSLSLPKADNWKNLLTGSSLKNGEKAIGLDQILSDWPVAVFISA